MKHFVYKPGHEPLIVETEEYESYLENGWYDTPAKFPENTQQVEVDPQENLDSPRRKGRPPKPKTEKIEPQSIAA